MSFLQRNHRQISCILRSNCNRVEYLQGPISGFEKFQIRKFSYQNESWIRRMYDKSRIFFDTHFEFGETAMSRSYTITLSVFVVVAFSIHCYAALVLDCYGTPMDVNRLPVKDSKLEVEKQKGDEIVSK